MPVSPLALNDVYTNCQKLAAVGATLSANNPRELEQVFPRDTLDSVYFLRQ